MHAHHPHAHHQHVQPPHGHQPYAYGSIPPQTYAYRPAHAAELHQSPAPHHRGSGYPVLPEPPRHAAPPSPAHPESGIAPYAAAWAAAFWDAASEVARRETRGAMTEVIATIREKTGAVRATAPPMPAAEPHPAMPAPRLPLAELAIDHPVPAAAGEAPAAAPPGAPFKAAAAEETALAGRPPAAEKGARRPRRFFRLAAMAAVLSFIAVVGWLAIAMVAFTIRFPDPFAIEADHKAPVIRILARDGSVLGERGAPHPYIPLKLLPTSVIEALVATEDRRFFNHWGVDPAGLARAALRNLRAGTYVEGGSTLTQQLAKNLFLSSERTLTRKLDELTLALWLELRLTKDQILELYLNRVYFGGGAYGIEAAAQRYFGKSAPALTLAEAALIAGLLKAPSRFSPFANPGSARARARSVLAKMRDAGYLTLAQYRAALRQPIRFARERREQKTNGTEYAIDFVLERMPSLIETDRGEIVVETTLDSGLQQRAQNLLTEELKLRRTELGAGQGAIVVLDSSGGVRALVGGASYTASTFNRATRARRQPGSAFKPFVYLTALENGLRPDTRAYDLPLAIDGWTPKNSDGQYAGEVDLRTALARSINTVAVRLSLDYKPESVAATAQRLGIRSKLRPEPSLALGTSEVNLLELTGAYSVFAAGGRRHEPYVINRIRTPSGRVLYAHAPAKDGNVGSLASVGAMNDMLNEALIAGTGRRAALERHPAAGKTGTSQEFRDAWFIGYTAHLTAGVWIGNDNGTPMKKVYGGSLPAEIWRVLMTDAHRTLEPLPLPGTRMPGTRIGPSELYVARTAPEPALADAQADAPPPAAPAPAAAPPPRASPVRSTQRTAPAAAKVGSPAHASPAPSVRRHPKESISEDFIARALAATPAAKPKKGGVAAAPRPMPGATGYDIEEIRRRLEAVPQTEPAPRQDRRMTLGGGGIAPDR